MIARNTLDDARKNFSLVKGKLPSTKSPSLGGVGDEETLKPKARRRRPRVVEDDEEE